MDLSEHLTALIIIRYRVGHGQGPLGQRRVPELGAGQLIGN